MKFNFDKLVERRGTHSVKWNIPTDSDIIPLWVADMDFEVAPAIQEAIVRRAEHPVYGYVSVPDEFYESAVNWFERRHGWKFEKDWIIYTIGVVPAISAVIKAFTTPGDKVLLQSPDYNCFFSSIRNNGCEIVESGLIYNDGRYTMDYDDLEAKAADEKVKMMLLCNPHNPAGRVWTKEELQKVADICQRNKVIVVSDEIHCELTHPGVDYVPFGTVTQNCIVCVSPSKSFNIAGLQVADIVTSNPEWRAKIDRAINDNEVCDVNPFGVEAFMAAYNGGEEWLNELREYLYGNYQLMCDFFKENYPQMTVTKNDGTYLGWVDIRSTGKTSDQLTKELLEKAHVWVNSGTMYSQKFGEGFIRINLATSRARLEEAFSRMKKVLG